MNTITSLEDHILNHCNESMEYALTADRHAWWKRNCPELSDIMFIRLGLLRCIAQVNSGRHFLQYNEDIHEDICPHSTYYKSLKSKRRMEMLKAVEKQSYRINSILMAMQGIDYLSEFPELDEYTVESADGHFVDHAEQTPKNDKGKVSAAGFIYAMDMRTGLFRALCCVTNGTIRSQELPVFRDHLENENRDGERPGKWVTIYDKAIIDFMFWERQKAHENYMISLKKENSVTKFVKAIPFDETSEINTGVESYELHQNGNATFSIVHYRDPETEKLHIFVTTMPTSINPGLIALLYFKRWSIEKAYDNSKNDLKEKKAWSSNKNALNCQMRFTAMAYNFMRLFEETSKAKQPDLIHPAVKKYDKELEKRQEKAEKKERFVNPLFFKKRIARICSFTIRAVQYAITKGKSYATFMKGLSKKFVPRPVLIGER